MVNITPLKTPRAMVDYSYLCSVLKMLFHCKRKTILNALKLRVDNAEEVLEKCNIDRNTRAEALSIEKLCVLANSLQAQKIALAE
ncbi:ribosomal RNA small subunit methyltransferase A [Anaplasma platys]|uniref:Ribosomal RNA small subunit methyltransferase A n=1 Tax=Anaplasma platys TaxID=949 RepID=A0A858PXU6_9RICK|nr:ribosomal RNA small subunit methyltransferase A [Anaplasma platys]